MSTGNPIKQRILKAAAAMRAATHSSKGKDVLMYLVFVFIAFIFWVLLSLDAEVTKDYELPMEVTEMPDSVHLIGSVPRTLNVTVKSKGAQLIRYEWGKMPVMKLKFADLSTKDNRLSASRIKLEAAVRDYFGAGVTVMALKPDSIGTPYTSRPGVRVPIHLLADIHTDLQYTVSGPIQCSADSVMLYSVSDIAQRLTQVNTTPIVRRDLKDTTVIVVPLEHIEGVKMVPAEVKVLIPVEPLIAKKRQIPVEASGCPAGTSLITFPSKVTISYLVPMSRYNSEQSMKAYVKYADISRNASKVPVYVTTPPPGCTGLTFSPDSVEYIIERGQ
ncbi:MAG: hypothetical protein NC187_00335 [Candidatus Amulumruptor caecigallinarius]|nr:hypothetical protein [Candidatus Amulumruptor caecigallinarius]MCM1395923.1 hypothetical protein [Candidatus Amulumruptor caecigallinarius]MCM1452958.1 hypothetical protein [bacterium]